MKASIQQEYFIKNKLILFLQHGTKWKVSQK